MFEDLVRVGSLVNLVPFNPRYHRQLDHESSGMAVVTWKSKLGDCLQVQRSDGSLIYVAIGDFYILQY
jgi:hypothetical protein